MGPTLGPLATTVSSALDANELKSLEAMAAESRPRLVTAYAEDDRIIIDSRGDAGLGSLLGSMLSAQSLGTFGHVVALAHAHQMGQSGGTIRR
jgi:hypothetical protein